MRKRATIRDVAEAAGVSTVTVSRVVNDSDLVQAETRARVERAMRELGYVPNLTAQAMRTNATRTIGFVVPDLTNYPNAAVAKATEAVLAEAGYCLLLTNSDNRLERELKSLEVLTSRRVDGMILYVCDEDDERLRQAVADVDVPLVVLDRDLPIECDTVLSDHDTAMGEAVRYLVAPALIAMVVMMPMLTVFADFVAIVGAGLYSMGPLDMSLSAYLTQTLNLLEPRDLWEGLSKSVVFAVLITLIGLSTGFSVTGGAEGVGRATTRAVVASITAIVIADMLFSFFLNR